MDVRQPQAAASVVVDDDAVFLKRWLRSPLSVASITPSGRALSLAMARQVDWSRPGSVVELGGGTGAITQALIDTGRAPERLVVVERDPVFCRHLARRFPSVAVICGDATEWPVLLRAAGVRRVNAVVSGLPLIAMGRAAQRAILDGTFAMGGPGAVLVQFTYGLGSPVPLRRLRRWGLSGRRADFALLNVPPAVVWCIGSASAAGGVGTSAEVRATAVDRAAA